MTKNWKIGAILGGILGLTISYIPLMWYYYAGTPATYIPPNPYIEGAMGFYFIWFLLTVFGIIFGTIVGYLTNRRNKTKSNEFRE